MKKVFILTFVWLIVVNIFGVVQVHQEQNIRLEAISIAEPETYRYATRLGWNPLATHIRFDSFWFIHTARIGYFFNEEEQFSNITSFPLYPALIALSAPLLGGNFIISALIISLFFLFASTAVLYKYTQKFHPEIPPLRPVIFLLIFPTAFFLNAAYAESLFLFLSITVFYLARNKYFVRAGFIAGLAALTRPQGVVLLVPLIVEYVATFGAAGFKKPQWLSFLLIPAAFFGFFLFHWQKFGSPWLFFRVHEWFGRHPVTLADGPFWTIIGVIIALFGLACMYFLLRRFRLSYGLYMVGMLAMPLASRSFMSLSRFLLVIFPIYFVLATIRHVEARYMWILVSLVLLLVNITFFVQGYWAG
ncbi:MAG: hypothetical protein A3F54_02560 [Candidatus Kerfeldbacteria bacterium RIFCSPHIGHO2_12_FULL_48_17]|uniref:Glycosyltransferase RgtA/B/C/D-like domain-containing protein n=1 Tax=Candidatus Kerfeldbacteria bacterium RIFCSPHIGHO2_12_FULL_48_17 TaxID=1798542 RepID=A0A1G2AX63_9BACT|nr:MAG: hypothetical protein A3F54_02560 [Candidatus Kerfeldbacteria bacterium RIFCSPHIGHO2_12_FULL_48_17]